MVRPPFSVFNDNRIMMIIPFTERTRRRLSLSPGPSYLSASQKPVSSVESGSGRSRRHHHRRRALPPPPSPPPPPSSALDRSIGRFRFFSDKLLQIPATRETIAMEIVNPSFADRYLDKRRSVRGVYRNPTFYSITARRDRWRSPITTIIILYNPRIPRA